MDLRILERATSVLMWLVFVSIPLFGGGILSFAAAFAFDRWDVAAGLGCCSLAAVPLCAIPMIALMRWATAGRARGFLSEVAAGLDEAEAQAGSWVWPMVAPRLSGRHQGREFRLILRRQAGILSPARVGGRFLMWGWMFDLEVHGRASGPIAFSEAPITGLGASLLGLPAPTALGEITGYAAADGQAALNRPAVVTAARAAVRFGSMPVLVRVGARTRSAGIVPADVTPEATLAWLNAVFALVAAAETEERTRPS